MTDEPLRTDISTPPPKNRKVSNSGAEASDAVDQIRTDVSPGLAMRRFCSRAGVLISKTRTAKVLGTMAVWLARGAALPGCIARALGVRMLESRVEKCRGRTIQA